MGNNDVVIYTKLQMPKEPGIYFRLLCLTGENKGTSYVLNNIRVVMGRSESADIHVVDTKASREHLELVKHKSTYILTDLGSHNGTIVNDLKVTQHRLADGDKIIIGKNVYKYNIVTVAEEEEEEEEGIDELTELDDEKSQVGQYKGSKADREKLTKEASKAKVKRMIVLTIVMFFAMLMLMDADKKKGTKKKIATNIGIFEGTNEFSRKMGKRKKAEKEKLENKVAILIHNGLRELREKNYYRAIYEFELALIMSPNHYRASFYLHKTVQDLNVEIDELFQKAARDRESLKLRESAKTYCSIMRLIDKNPDDTRYKEAKENIKVVENELGLKENEIKCN